MAKIKIREFGKLRQGPPDASEDNSPGVLTYPIFSASSDALHARLHRMPAGTSVSWQGSKTGTVIFVWSGEVRVAGRILSANSTIVIEHCTSLSVEAVATRATEILVFNANTELPLQEAKQGGHVHLLPASEAPNAPLVNAQLNVGATLFADSGCGSCDLWLHANDFHNSNATIPLHRHSEDEIIVVTRGEILLGSRPYGPGTAIAIAHDTIYGFGTGPSGMSFINFRAHRPTFGFPDQNEMADERGYYASMRSPIYSNL